MTHYHFSSDIYICSYYNSQHFLSIYQSSFKQLNPRRLENEHIKKLYSFSNEETGYGDIYDTQNEARENAGGREVLEGYGLFDLPVQQQPEISNDYMPWLKNIQATCTK